MAIQQQYGEGADPTMVWRDVKAVIERMNALENMIVHVKSPNPTTGKIEIHGDHSVLTLS